MEDTTANRLLRVEKAALELAKVVEDLVREMEMITLNLPDGSKRTHEIGEAKRP